MINEQDPNYPEHARKRDELKEFYGSSRMIELLRQIRTITKPTCSLEEAVKLLYDEMCREKNSLEYRTKQAQKYMRIRQVLNLLTDASNKAAGEWQLQRDIDDVRKKWMDIQNDVRIEELTS